MNFKNLIREGRNPILKINLKNSIAKTMRLRVWGYSQGEYLYLLSDRGRTMKYKTYSTAKRKDISK